jgi:hypothetical protein
MNLYNYNPSGQLLFAGFNQDHGIYQISKNFAKILSYHSLLFIFSGFKNLIKLSKSSRIITQF